MPRYSLRTLLLVVLVAGPLLAWGWGNVESVIQERQATERAAIEAERAKRAETERRELLSRIIGFPNRAATNAKADDMSRRVEELYDKLRALKSRQ